jgi:hypothetical protein
MEKSYVHKTTTFIGITLLANLDSTGKLERTIAFNDSGRICECGTIIHFIDR